MEFILKLILTPLVLLAASKFLKGVYVKDYKAAFLTCIAIMVVGFLIGWIFTLMLNVATLGIFWIIGLGFITHTIANAVVIEIIDWFRKDFDTAGFLPSLWLSILFALSWTIIDLIF